MAMSVVGLGSANAAPPLPSLDAAIFAKQPARLNNGITGEIVRFPSHSPKEWTELLGGRRGAPIDLTAQIFRPNAVSK